MKKNSFFNMVKYSSKINLINKSEDISWVVVFQGIYQEELGISEIGEWIFWNKKDYYPLNKKKMYLYSVKLLEYSYDTIEKQLYRRFDFIIKNKEISIFEIFPFFEIVEFVFEYMNNEYWFELAWLWYEHLSFLDKYRLVGLLEKISSNKKFSQKNRQKVRKEINFNNKKSSTS